MAGLIPFNRNNNHLTRSSFEDFHNMLDDFFSDGWMSDRSLLRDTFKIDIEEIDNEYRVEAELPGINKDEIEINIDNDGLCILVNHNEEVNQDSKNYIHRERRRSSMKRRIHLTNAKMDDIVAKLEDGILTITIPKEKTSNNSRKIDIK